VTTWAFSRLVGRTTTTADQGGNDCNAMSPMGQIWPFASVAPHASFTSAADIRDDNQSRRTRADLVTSDRFRFLEKIASGQVAMAHAGPRWGNGPGPTSLVS
jgi:hypothetical protein